MEETGSSMFGFCVLVLMCMWIDFGSCQDFGYDDDGSEGPNHWGDKYAKCIGKHQSPIDIEAQNVLKEKFPPLIFDDFGTKLKLVRLQNNGHTVLLSIKEGKVPAIHGGPLKGKYSFSQMHFHWGPNDTLGSENQVNHHSFPLELHMVMYNSKYANMTDALDFQDGLTVLSFLYSVSDRDNNIYDQFEDGLNKVTTMLSSTYMRNFVSLNDFTTHNKQTYFTYEGSLTTPPCSEVVTWIEFLNTIPLSKLQINAFRSLSTKTGNLTHNYRPIQPLYDRAIYLNGSTNIRLSTYAFVNLVFFVLFKNVSVSFI